MSHGTQGDMRSVANEMGQAQHRVTPDGGVVGEGSPRPAYRLLRQSALAPNFERRIKALPRYPDGVKIWGKRPSSGVLADALRLRVLSRPAVCRTGHAVHTIHPLIKSFRARALKLFRAPIASQCTTDHVRMPARSRARMASATVLRAQPARSDIAS